MEQSFAEVWLCDKVNCCEQRFHSLEVNLPRPNETGKECLLGQSKPPRSQFQVLYHREQSNYGRSI